MAGNIVTAPGASPAVCAIHNKARTAAPVAHQNGAPAPSVSNSSASASSGITTKVVKGIATILATAP